MAPVGSDKETPKTASETPKASARPDSLLGRPQKQATPCTSTPPKAPPKKRGRKSAEMQTQADKSAFKADPKFLKSKKLAINLDAKLANGPMFKIRASSKSDKASSKSEPSVAKGYLLTFQNEAGELETHPVAPDLEGETSSAKPKLEPNYVNLFDVDDEEEDDDDDVVFEKSTIQGCEKSKWEARLSAEEFQRLALQHIDLTNYTSQTEEGEQRTISPQDSATLLPQLVESYIQNHSKLKLIKYVKWEDRRSKVEKDMGSRTPQVGDFIVDDEVEVPVVISTRSAPDGCIKQGPQPPLLLGGSGRGYGYGHVEPTSFSLAEFDIHLRYLFYHISPPSVARLHTTHGLKMFQIDILATILHLMHDESYLAGKNGELLVEDGMKRVVSRNTNCEKTMVGAAMFKVATGRPEGTPPSKGTFEAWSCATLRGRAQVVADYLCQFHRNWATCLDIEPSLLMTINLRQSIDQYKTQVGAGIVEETAVAGPHTLGRVCARHFRPIFYLFNITKGLKNVEFVGNDDVFYESIRRGDDRMYRTSKEALASAAGRTRRFVA